MHIRFSILAGSALLLGLLAPGVQADQAPAPGCADPNGAGGCATTIQAAVDAAGAGATIAIRPGTYRGAVTITKPINLAGDAAATVIIDATGLKSGITINKTGPVGVTGITVMDAQLAGIAAHDASGLTIAHDIVTANDKNLKLPADHNPANATCEGAPAFQQMDCGEGILLDGVANSSITDNLVTGDYGGLLVTDESAANHDNTIARNLVEGNQLDCGITLASHPAGFGPKGPMPGNGVFNNLVLNNVVTGNGASGVGLFGPTPGTAVYNNTVNGNILTKNGIGGVALHAHSPAVNLSGNTITNNYVSGNGFLGDPGVTQDHAGIVVFADDSSHADPITNLTISGNLITGQPDAVWTGSTANSLKLTGNDFTGAAVGVANDGRGDVDASGNYWGCGGGPGQSGCAGVKGSVKAGPAAASSVAKATPGITRDVTASGVLVSTGSGAFVSYTLPGDNSSYLLTVGFGGGTPTDRTTGVQVLDASGKTIAMATEVNGMAVVGMPSSLGQWYTVQLFTYQPGGISYTISAS